MALTEDELGGFWRGEPGLCTLVTSVQQHASLAAALRLQQGAVRLGRWACVCPWVSKGFCCRSSSMVQGVEGALAQG